MRTNKTIVTKIDYHLDQTDLRTLLQNQKLIPDDWEFFSINVESSKDNKGLKISIEKNEN